MEEKSVLAKNLVKYRQLAGLSQLELAKKLNYSNKNISKWENGETTPSVFTLQKIAEIFGISVDKLLTNNEEDIQEAKVESKRKLRNKALFRVAMLFLANIILFALVSIAVYVLGLTNVTSFNKWLLYLYASPLTFLSIAIYIRVRFKLVEIFTLSAFTWLVVVSVYISLKNAIGIDLIFIVGAACELLVIAISVILNIKLYTKYFLKLKHKLKHLKNIKKEKK